MVSHWRGWVVVIVVLLCAGTGHAADMHGVVDSFLAKYQASGKTWEVTISNAATSVFWILAMISMGWTCISMGLKRADLMEICAELCRFIMFTGLFYWLLLNAPGFANKITESLRQVGGDAVRGGKAIYPGDLITLGMGVFLNTLKQINYLLPQLSVVPATVALVILIVCCLIAVNMILLLCASWVVIYAGIIFLGFGGCRWTSDLAVNYYRTVLGIGVSLMTMELIIGLGVQLLQQLAASIGDHPDVGQLALVMCATIILAVLAHRLPHMVAGIATGGGYGGAVGGIGVMSLIGAGVAGMSLARSMGGGAAAAVAAEAGVQAHKQLMERIASAEAAVAAGSGGANTGSVVADSGSRPQTDQGLHWPGSRVTRGAGAGGPEGVGETVATRTTATEGKQGKQAAAGGVTPAVAGSEPPQTRPMTANEARGYPPEKPGEPIDWEDERRRIVRGDGNFWKPEA